MKGETGNISGSLSNRQQALMHPVRSSLLQVMALAPGTRDFIADRFHRIAGGKTYSVMAKII